MVDTNQPNSLLQPTALLDLEYNLKSSYKFQSQVLSKQ
ncbi:uncharacterized protein METZ01_LOCUS30804 [marine metagenome]|uniref:Uncharacterized protein n=1 Tax=marine metagenome TaxID=408172 RepID=A0A381QG48_9ZZZZ